jgi:uncharacterized Ntn-hydrolase superfamily protein
MSNLRIVGLLLGAVGVLAPATASATYSIVATDRATRHVGGAVTSCVGPNRVDGVYGSAPGRGAVAAQAASNAAGRDRAVQLLRMNASPAQIIAAITSPSFDPRAASRQYGVVDLMGRAAAHTGSQNGFFAGSLQRQIQTFTYSVQGNILTGRAVLTQAASGFDTQACDLPERLMRALETGAANNQGDARCIGSSARSPSDSAFIEVDRPGEPAGSYLRLSVVTRNRANPLPALRQQFNVWRRTHPCPAPGVLDAEPALLDAEDGDEAVWPADDASDSDTATPQQPAAAPGAENVPGAPTESTEPDDASTATGDLEPGGCGVTSRGYASAFSVLTALVVAATIRRTRRAPRRR